MELPYHLKTLEPLTGALDILRHLRGQSDMLAPVGVLLDDLALSERAFGKAIRRLVTQGYVQYVQMDAEAVYRLTDTGRRAADELIEYEQSTGVRATGTHSIDEFGITGRVVMSVPEAVGPQTAIKVVVGTALDSDSSLPSPVDLIIRLSTVNAQVDSSQDAVLTLAVVPVHHTFTVKSSHKSKARIRINVYQLKSDGEDVLPCGGFYVDLPVKAGADTERRVAYGSAIALKANA